MDWREAVQAGKKEKLRELYLQEQWQSSTPMYYSTNVSEFSTRIQRAVTRIMKEQNLPVTVSCKWVQGFIRIVCYLDLVGAFSSRLWPVNVLNIY